MNKSIFLTDSYRYESDHNSTLISIDLPSHIYVDDKSDFCRKSNCAVFVVRIEFLFGMNRNSVDNLTIDNDDIQSKIGTIKCVIQETNNKLVYPTPL